MIIYKRGSFAQIIKTGIILLVLGVVALGAGAWLFGVYYETSAALANFLCKTGAVFALVGLASALIGWIMKRKKSIQTSIGLIQIHGLQ